VIIVAFVAAIVFAVFGALKSTDVYKTAGARAHANLQVNDALGSPLKEGMFVSGSTHATGADGSAELAIPISARKATARSMLWRRSRQANGSYSRLLVEVAQTKQRINVGADKGVALDEQ
jgi:hypothetical protein